MSLYALVLLTLLTARVETDPARAHASAHSAQPPRLTLTTTMRHTIILETAVDRSLPLDTPHGY